MKFEEDGLVRDGNPRIAQRVEANVFSRELASVLHERTVCGGRKPIWVSILGAL